MYVKPSRRYEIEDHLCKASPDVGLNENLSVQGKALVARQRRYVCGCLALLGAKKDSIAFPRLGDFLSSACDVGTGDEEDTSFQQNIVELTCSALCKASSIAPALSYAVRTNHQPVLLSVITALLDSTMLAKFPTCNFEAVRKLCGRDSEEKEFTRLRALQDASNGHCKRPLGGETWQLCESLARSKDKESTAEQKLAQALLLETDRAGMIDSIEPCSVEWESFKRIRLLTSIIGIFSGQNPQEFEKICSHIVAKSSEELTLVGKRLAFSYNDCANENGESNGGYRKAKMTELISCYSEIHVTLLAWVLRKTQNNHSPNFEATLLCIRNQFFTAILQKDQNLAAQSLRRLTTVSRTPLLDDASSKLVGNDSPSTSFIIPQVIEFLRNTFVRRSRDIVLHLSKLPEQHNAGRLLNSMVAVGIGRNCNNVEDGQVKNYSHELAFSFSQKLRKPLSLQSTTCVSPLHGAVGKYILESKHPPTATEMLALWELKHAVLGKHLIPRLRHNLVVSDNKVKKLTVLLVKAILDAENNASFSLIDGSQAAQEMNLFSLRDLTNGLVVGLRNSLDPKEGIGTTLVSSFFQLAKALSSSRISTSTDGLQSQPPPSSTTMTTTTVAKWGRAWSSPLDEIDETATLEELVGSYVWFSLMWIKSIAEAIVDHSEGATERLQKLCQQLQTNKNLWPQVSSEMEISLAFLTDHFFPEKNKALNVVNVYAKKSRVVVSANGGDEDDSIPVMWIPDTYVLKAAKNFLIEIIPLC